MNLTSHRIRASAALFAALFAAALLQLVLINMGSLNISGTSLLPQFGQTLSQTFLYGLPLGAAAVVATEYLRLRRLSVLIVIGTLMTFVAAHLATRGEPLASYIFTGGILTGLGLAAAGVMSSAIYWAMAGRHAGWRGDSAEAEHELAAKAYLRASEKAQSELCLPCLYIWAGSSVAAFVVFAWLVIGAMGLRSGLVAESEREGKSVLTASGYAWASFTIAEGRGSIEGTAPDELQKRLAYDAAREALYAVTGFPGVISQIEDKAVPAVLMSSVNQQLADAKQREEEAQHAIEEARRMAEAARTAAAEDEERVRVAALAGGAGAQAAAQSAANDLDQPSAVSAEVMPAPDTTAEAPSDATADGAVDLSPGMNDGQEDDVAALNIEAPSAAQVGAIPRAVDGRHACTGQDLAMVESSQILFPSQSFEILARYQRELDRIAASILSCAPQPVEITGQSDSNADQLFNPALGFQRAEAVRNGLIARGIEAIRISTRAAPLGLSGDTSEPVGGREAYRKTNFKFIETAALSRDATQGPDERASNCESDLSEIMSRSIIHFGIASSRVSLESMGLIKQLAGAIQTCGSVIVTVEGHTDKIGTPDRNQQLSVARAEAVREALVAYGADPTRLASRGFASTRPAAQGDTAEAYALNRRIEFKVSGKFTSDSTGGP